MRIEVSKICTWNKSGVGTKVLHPEIVIEHLESAIDAGSVNFDEHGHAFVPCPQLASAVSCGVGLHTNNEADYVVRSYRGQVSAYLRRDKAATADFVAVVLYTREGYIADPDSDITPEERARIAASDCEYVVVCVLAAAGAKAPVEPRRFCANLSGNNPEWTAFDKETLVRMAAESTLYHDTWSVVSD